MWNSHPPLSLLETKGEAGLFHMLLCGRGGCGRVCTCVWGSYPCVRVGSPCVSAWCTPVCVCTCVQFSLYAVCMCTCMCMCVRSVVCKVCACTCVWLYCLYGACVHVHMCMCVGLCQALCVSVCQPVYLMAAKSSFASNDSIFQAPPVRVDCSQTFL